MKKDKKYPGVYQDKNGTYYYKFSALTLDRVRVHKTKRGFSTARIAYETKLVEKSKIEQQKCNSNKPDLTSFENLIEEYIDRLRTNSVKETTLLGYKRQFNKHIIPHFQNNAITIQEVMNFKKYITDLNVQTERKNQIIKLLKRFIQHLHLFFYIDSVVLNTSLQVLTVMKLNDSKAGCKGTYTPDEFNLFVNHLNIDKYKLLARIIYNTGCRIGEALGLSIDNIDLINNSITFDKIATVEKPYIRKGLKTQNSRTTSILNSTTLLIKEYIISNSLSGTQLLFSMESNPTRPIGHGHIINMFNRAQHEARLPRIRPHDLRHSHVNFLLDEGVSPKAVANRVGHKNETTTLNIYNQITKIKQDKLDQTLNELEKQLLH